MAAPPAGDARGAGTAARARTGAGDLKRLHRVLLDSLPSLPADLCALVSYHLLPPLPLALSTTYGTVGEDRGFHFEEFNTMPPPILALVLQGWSVRGIVGFSQPRAHSRMGTAALRVQLAYGPSTCRMPKLKPGECEWHPQNKSFAVHGFAIARQQMQVVIARQRTTFSLRVGEVIRSMTWSQNVDAESVVFEMNTGRTFAVGQVMREFETRDYTIQAPDGCCIIGINGEQKRRIRNWSAAFAVTEFEQRWPNLSKKDRARRPAARLLESHFDLNLKRSQGCGQAYVRMQRNCNPN